MGDRTAEARTVEAPATQQHSLRVVFAGPDFCVSSYANVIFSCENIEPTIAHIDRLHSTIVEVARREKRGVGFMTVLRPDAKPASDEVRHHIKRITKAFAPHVRAMGHVVEGDGFMAAAKRAGISLLMNMAKFSFPLKVFPDMSAGLRWMSFKADNSWSPDFQDDIVGLVNALRQKHFKAP